MELPRVEAYVVRTFIPTLGISGRRITLEPPVRPGTRSQIQILRIDGLGPLLVRLWSSRQTALRNVEALRHLARVGLPAPRLIFQDLSVGARWIRALDGGVPYVTIESFVEGTRLSDLPPGTQRKDALLATARLLRRFRYVARDRWGRPERAALRPYTHHAASSIRRMLSGIRRAGWIQERQRGEAERNLGKWFERIDRFAPFTLVHKDINPDNLILTPDGEIYPVDLHRLAYEPFPEDLLNALRHLLPGQPGEAQRFLEDYFGEGGDLVREQFETTRGFFEPYYALKRLFRLVGREETHPGRAERPELVEAILAVRPPAL